MIEKELKALINKEQYESLLNLFDWHEVRTQTNYYYTGKENSNKNKGITIRVREVNDKVLLQVKVPIYNEHDGDQGVLHLSKEFEAELNEVPEEIEGAYLSNLCSIPFPDVCKVGFLTTERHIYNWSDNIEISLDKNTYFDVEDYEIEIEYKESIDPALIELLEKNNISFQNKTDGKCKRFFNELKKY